jgi:integrase
MAQKRYTNTHGDNTQIDRYVIRAGGTDAWKGSHKSLIEQVIGMINKPLSGITVDDIFKIRDKILNSKYRDNYKRRLIFAMKKFFIWYGKQHKIDFTELETIKIPPGQWKTKTPGDMLSTENIETILKACRNTRDRCFVAMLWDGSNRPIELLRLTWQDILQDEYGYSFTTDAKTKKERHIRLTMSIPYLDEWRRNYPGEAKGGKPVFITIRKVGPDKEYRQWDIDAAQFMIKTLREATGLKNLKPSMFRPSRITHDVKAGYDLPYIMKKNWGHLKTPMIDLYTNIDASYIDQVALRQAGMTRRETVKEQEQHKIEPPVCKQCGSLNTLGSQFCSRCQSPLTEEAQTKIDIATRKIDELISEEDYIEAAREIYRRRTLKK